MSWAAMLWAHNLTADPRGGRLTPTEKLLLVMLAMKHDEQTTFGYATVAWIAEHSLVSDRQAIRIVQDLQERGLVKVETKAQSHGPSGQRINRYYLPQVVTPASLPGGDTGDTTRAKVVTPASKGGDTGGKTINEEKTIKTTEGDGPENEGRKSKARGTRGAAYVRPSTPEWLLPFERTIQGLAGYAPTEMFYEQLRSYPGLDLVKEGVKLADWCRRHNAHASTTRIINWLDRAKADHGRAEPIRDAIQPPPQEYIDPRTQPWYGQFREESP